MLGDIGDHNRVAIRRKNQLGEVGRTGAPTQGALPDEAGGANAVPTAHEYSPIPAAASATNQENAATMLEVHAPHQIVHTWKDFLIHPQAEQRYMAIAREKAEAHPTLKYIFNAN